MDFLVYVGIIIKPNQQVVKMTQIDYDCFFYNFSLQETQFLITYTPPPSRNDGGNRKTDSKNLKVSTFLSTALPFAYYLTKILYTYSHTQCKETLTRVCKYLRNSRSDPSGNLVQRLNLDCIFIKKCGFILPYKLYVSTLLASIHFVFFYVQL